MLGNGPIEILMLAIGLGVVALFFPQVVLGIVIVFAGLGLLADLLTP